MPIRPPLTAMSLVAGLCLMPLVATASTPAQTPPVVDLKGTWTGTIEVIRPVAPGEGVEDAPRCA